MGQIPKGERVKKYHIIANIHFDKHFLAVRVDEKDYRIDLRRYSRKLASADERTRMNYVVSPSCQVNAKSAQTPTRSEGHEAGSWGSGGLK